MGKFRLLTTVVMAMALTLGLAGMAFASSASGTSAKLSCGECHGVYTNNTLPNITGAAIKATDMRATGQTAPYESSILPQMDNDRGLHGIHMNYSSASYPTGYGKANGTQVIGGTTYNKRGVCQVCHAANHPNHESGFMQWSTTSTTTSTPDATYDPNFGWPATKGFMRYSSNQGGTSDRPNTISSLESAPRTGTCTAACHKGTSSASPAPWGNYTTASIKLTCNSCHADSGGVAPGSTSEPALSGLHVAHLGSSVLVNNTSLNQPNNGSCLLCHPDNRGQGKTTKDWGPGLGMKAYPHAKDGTNVVSTNVNTANWLPSASLNVNASQVSCTSNCHPRSSTITGLSWATGQTLDCNMCHYYPGTPSNGTDTGAGALPGAHEIHLTNAGLTCTDCHPIPSDLSHVTALPVGSTGASAGVVFTANVGTVTGTGLNRTCTNNCHTTGSYPWSTVVVTYGCNGCHEYPNTVTGGKGDWAITNGHAVRSTFNQATSVIGLGGSLKHLSASYAYNALTDTYNGVTNDVTKCGKCHNGITHMNTTTVAQAYSGSGTSVQAKASKGFTLVNHTPLSSAQCSNAKCHFNRTTPNWY